MKSDHRLVPDICLILGLLAFASTATAVGFLPVANTALPTQAVAGAAGDVDGDGFDEVALAIPNTFSIGVLWNRGEASGGFDPVELLPAGLTTSSVLLADLNSDGFADLAAVGIGTDSTLVVKFATGGRGFGATTTYGLPAGATDGVRLVRALDIDGDLDLDLLVAEELSLVVFINRGDGSFESGRTDAVPGFAVERIAVGRFDALPGIDVMLQFGDGFGAFTNDGSGRLVARPPIATGLLVHDAVAIDLDLDGFLDIADSSEGVLTAYFNDGTGIFSAGPAWPVRAMTVSRAVDLNADGRLDLLTGSLSDGGIEVRYGDGGFTAPTTIDRVAFRPPFVVGDFNGDGEASDLLSGETALSLRELLSAGTASLSTPTSYDVGRGPSSIASADFDFDGDLDLVTADALGGTLSRLENSGDGTFTGGASLSAGLSAIDIAAPDLDADGWPDIVALARRANLASTVNEVIVFRNLGGGVFDPVPESLSVGQGPTSISTGDLDLDGDSDIVVVDGEGATLHLVRSETNRLSIAASVAVDLIPTDAVTTDLDGDGDLDIVVVGISPDANGSVGALQVLENHHHLTDFLFTTTQSLSGGMGPTSLVAVDLDRDGFPEIAAIDPETGTILLYANLGGGFLAQPFSIDLAGRPTALTAGYMNCDAAEDLVVTVERAGVTHREVFLSHGDGSLAMAQPIPGDGAAVAILTGDLDHDGSEDVVVANATMDQLDVSLNDACSADAACSVSTLAISGPSVGCFGADTTLEATGGFARYLWSGGQTGARLVMPNGALGVRRIGLTAFGADGCVGSAEFDLLVVDPPVIEVSMPRRYGCAAGLETTRFVLSGRVPASGAAFQWSVDAPGVVLDPWLAETWLEFPPGMSTGDFQLRLEGVDGAGCLGADTEMVHFVDEDPGHDPVLNSVRVAPAAGGGVRVAWDANGADRHSVLRGPLDSIGGPLTSHLADVEGGSDYIDRNIASGSVHYGVRAESPCSFASSPN